MDQQVSGAAHAGVDEISPDEPLGALAVTLWERFHARSTPLVYVAASSSRAQALADLLTSLDPGFKVAHLPAWDALPYDRNSPSRRTMGLRAGVFRWMIDAESRPQIVVTSVRGITQRTPPPEAWADAHLTLAAGDRISPQDLRRALERLGYAPDDQAEEPGMFAIGGQVIDIFPAAAPRPCRVELADDVVTEIRSFDPVTQRSVVEADVLQIDPASEIIRAPEDGGAALPAGAEHHLSAYYPKLTTLFDYAPKIDLVVEHRAIERAQDFFEQLQDAFENEMALAQARRRTDRMPLPPERLYVTEQEWKDWLDERLIAVCGNGQAPAAANLLPSFATLARGKSSFTQFCADWLTKGAILLAASDEKQVAALTRRLPERSRKVEACASIAQALSTRANAVLSLRIDLPRGFVYGRLAIIAAADVLGRTSIGTQPRQRTALHGRDLAIGAPVVHFEHGIGIVEGLETVTGIDAQQDVVRLAFAESRLMVPVGELWKIWPYDAEADGLKLDRVDGSSWPARRAQLESDIAAAARHLVTLARERETTPAPRLQPPAHLYERFAARFPFTPTPDQSAAIVDVLTDLRSGRPMDRLICGDVGYGKTEVALHAAAAAALAGKQVAVIAPTTVLARQHLSTFQRRFRGLGVPIVHLSRLMSAADVREAKAKLASGEARIVVGTHAILSKTVRFDDLALVVVDEEQRFGAAQKNALSTLSKSLHRLSMTATPIPRTLQTALVGIRDLSVLATPPSARTPVRTLLLPFEAGTVRHALLHEHERNGQSFVVCPRIEDLPEMQSRLQSIVPNLSILVIHGKMPAQDVDEILMRFTDGDGDVLLSTNIIESGLDIPNANTMIVWRPDRFGLAQLHQIRGRVGRGARRGVLYLMRDDAQDLPASAERRLRVLEQLDRLGAGFEISARDLAQRGAGDLTGEEQAGHMKLIGSDLYEHLLQRAIASARGETPGPDWMPEVHTGLTALIPESYVPEADIRLGLYRRLVTLAGEDDVDDLALEFEDRFGPIPPETAQLLNETRLSLLCRAMGIIKLDAGPAAMAVTALGADDDQLCACLTAFSFERREERFILKRSTPEANQRAALLEELARHLGSAIACSPASSAPAKG